MLEIIPKDNPNKFEDLYIGDVFVVGNIRGSPKPSVLYKKLISKDSLSGFVRTDNDFRYNAIAIHTVSGDIDFRMVAGFTIVTQVVIKEINIKLQEK